MTLDGASDVAQQVDPIGKQRKNRKRQEHAQDWKKQTSPKAASIHLTLPASGSNYVGSPHLPFKSLARYGLGPPLHLSLDPSHV